MSRRMHIQPVLPAVDAEPGRGHRDLRPQPGRRSRPGTWWPPKTTRSARKKGSPGHHRSRPPGIRNFRSSVAV